MYSLMLATEGAGVSEMVSTATELFANVANAITGNPILSAFVGISLLGVAFTLFKRAKNASRG
ncbi:MAG: hypothetical protein ACI4KH_08950 [Oscillospiraceae bacterium]